MADFIKVITKVITGRLRRGRRSDVHLCAFDLVEIDGRDLRLETRKYAGDFWPAWCASRDRGWCSTRR